MRRAAALRARGTQITGDLRFIELADRYREGRLPAGEEQELAALCRSQKASERKEQEQAWLSGKLIEIERRRSRTESDELFLALAKIPKRTDEEEREFQLQIIRLRKLEEAAAIDLATIAKSKARKAAAAQKDDERRRQRTKNLCDAGGLMVKAGFLKEGTGEFAYSREIVYGMLLDAIQRCGNYQQQWADMGRKAFQEEAAASAAENKPAAPG